MADSIKIGNLDISSFKVGSDNCKVYLGDVLLYPQTVSYKLIAQYSDASEYKVECDGSSALTPSEVSGHTTAKSAMTSAVVSDCIQRIDTNAFYGCSAMTSITIDDNVSELGGQAFFGCSGLTSFTFPSGLTKIENACFRLANSIKRIEGIPSGVTYLGSGCFADMASLSAATIPATVTGGSTNIFLRDANLKEVHFQGTMPPSFIGTDVFKNCTSLQKIYIPSCDSYDSYAANSNFSAYTNLIYAEDATKCKPESYPFVFKREHNGGSAYTRACDSTSATTLLSGMTRSGTTIGVISGTSKQVTAITVGDCTAKIGAGAFSGWTKVRSIIISDKVNEIARYSFYLTSKDASGECTLKLGKNVSTIGNNAFTNTSNIKYASIPSGVTTLSHNVFSNGGLTGLTFQNGFNFTSNSSSGFCDNCSNLRTVTLPSSVKYIPANTFRYNGKLSSIDLHNVTNFGGYSFAYCSGLTQNIILSSVKTLDNNSFANCNFQRIEIGTACTTINSAALDNNDNLMTIIVRAATPPTMSVLAWSRHQVNGSYYPLIYVPDDKVNTYKNYTGGWQNCKNEIRPLSDLN